MAFFNSPGTLENNPLPDDQQRRDMFLARWPELARNSVRNQSYDLGPRNEEDLGGMARERAELTSEFTQGLRPSYVIMDDVIPLNRVPTSEYRITNNDLSVASVRDGNQPRVSMVPIYDYPLTNRVLFVDEGHTISAEALRHTHLHTPAGTSVTGDEIFMEMPDDYYDLVSENKELNIENKRLLTVIGALRSEVNRLKSLGSSNGYN